MERSYKTIPIIASFLVFISVLDVYINSTMPRTWILDNTYIHYEETLSISTVTGAFFHNDFTHLFKNLTLICITLPIISLRYDDRKILAIFVSSAIFGAFIFSVTSDLLTIERFARGSSGGTFFLLGISVIIASERSDISKERIVAISVMSVLLFESSKYVLDTELFPINMAVSATHISCIVFGIYFDHIYRYRTNLVNNSTDIKGFRI